MIIAKFQPRILGVTPEKMKRWTPSVACITIASFIYFCDLLEPVPKFRRDFLLKTPVLGKYWSDKIPSDKPDILSHIHI